MDIFRGRRGIGYWPGWPGDITPCLARPAVRLPHKTPLRLAFVSRDLKSPPGCTPWLAGIPGSQPILPACPGQHSQPTQHAARHPQRAGSQRADGWAHAATAAPPPSPSPATGLPTPRTRRGGAYSSRWRHSFDYNRGISDSFRQHLIIQKKLPELPHIL
jgi:hypothetical protein